LNQDRKERAEKLKRRLSKVCQYVSGVSNLILKAKRLFPIPHRWVTDTFVGTGEGTFDLCDSVHDAISRELDQPCSSTTIMDKLDKHFPSILDNWAKQQTVHACVHAELRIILHLGLPSSQDSHPIGVSKRSCYCCMLWIESHNLIFGTKWTTSGSHGKPYANWALPGAACSYAVEDDGKSAVDKAVLDGVSIRFKDTLDWLFPGQKRISDDHVSSGESSDGGILRGLRPTATTATEHPAAQQLRQLQRNKHAILHQRIQTRILITIHTSVALILIVSIAGLPIQRSWTHRPLLVIA
jgi:hypothetical protein